MAASRTFPIITTTAGVGGDLGSDMRYVDLTSELDDGETVDSCLVVTTDTTNCSISSYTKNTAAITYGSNTIAIGKGVQFRSTALVEDSVATAPVRVSYVSTNGKKETIETSQPLAKTS